MKCVHLVVEVRAFALVIMHTVHVFQVFVALALALGCGRFNVGRAPSFNDLRLE